MSRTARRTRGSMALEMSILAPVLILLLLLIMAFGRYIHAVNVVEATAEAAARGASQARSSDEASDAVTAALADTKANENHLPSSCLNSLDGQVKSFGEAGSSVSVQVTCTVDFKDLNFLALNVGSQTISKTYVSPLDQYRGVVAK